MRALGARSAYFWLKLVEATAVPLSVFLAIFVLSGYGMVLPSLMRFIGFSYRVSVYLHSHPLLRYATVVLISLHGYGGFVLLANRYVRNSVFRKVLQALGLAYSLLLLFTSTVAELFLMMR